MINKFIEKGIENNRWLERYFRFIEKFGVSERISGYENHHILPQFMFKEYSNLSKNKWNSVYLSKRAHFIAHYILAKGVETSMWRAVVYIGDTRFGGNLHSRLYDEAKSKANNTLSEKQKGNGNVSKRPEVREKISKSLSAYYKDKPGPNSGKKTSEETKKKQSEAAKNREPNRRKNWKLISPEGSITLCDGSLKSVVVKYELSWNTLKKFIGSAVPAVSKYRQHYNTPVRARTTGWTLIEL